MKRKIELMNFMAVIRRKVYGNPNHKDGGVMSEKRIADHLNEIGIPLTPDEVNVIMWEAVYEGITDRQGGMFVI